MLLSFTEHPGVDCADHARCCVLLTSCVGGFLSLRSHYTFVYLCILHTYIIYQRLSEEVKHCAYKIKGL